VVNYIDRSAIAFTLDKLELSFHLSDFQLGMILGGFGIGYAITTFLGGIWVDHFGPRRIMTIAVLMWAVSMFSIAVATGFAMLLFSRILLGVSEGPNFPAMTRSVADWLPTHERGRSLSYALMSVPIAIAIGAPIVTQLIIHLSWRGMFVVLGAVALLWIPVWLIFFRNKPSDSPHVSQAELAVIANEQTPAPHHDRHVPKSAWRYLLTNRTLLANYWAFFVFGYFLFFFMGWLPNYLTQVYHMNLKQQGLFTMLPWILGAVMMWLMGHITDTISRKTGKLRYARSYPILITQLLASLCVLPIAWMQHPDLTITVILISLAVGFSMSANANYYAVNIDIAKDRSGTALGVMDTFFAIAGFIAPVMTGYLVGLTHSFDAGFALVGLFGLSSVVVVAIFHRPDQA
jgi:ACS family hexuronate transporter-like MFS transporter